MDIEQKRKLDELRQQARIAAKKKSLMKNVLLQECLEALGCYKVIEDECEIEQIEKSASSRNAEMHTHDEQVVLEDAEQYYIVWDEATIPTVVCSGKRINECWDDVLAVAFDTYFVAESTGKTIGIRH